jgi:glutathionylspermidine synthase
VLAQILSRGPAKDETHARTEEDQVGEVDIENQCGENGRDKTSSTRPQNNEDYEDEMHVEVEENESENDEDEDFQAPLLSLCVTICDTFISTDQDLSCHFDAFSLPRKLEDMLAENSIPTVHCLRLMKLTCKMVISMMKHRSNYLKEELESLTEALSRASESMSLLDMSMVFASKDDGAATTMKPVRSLSSLVKEAKEIVATHFKAHEIENMQAVTSADG